MRGTMTERENQWRKTFLEDLGGLPASMEVARGSEVAVGMAVAADMAVARATEAAAKVSTVEEKVEEKVAELASAAVNSDTEQTNVPVVAARVTTAAAAAARVMAKEEEVGIKYAVSSRRGNAVTATGADSLTSDFEPALAMPWWQILSVAQFMAVPAQGMYVTKRQFHHLNCSALLYSCFGAQACGGLIFHLPSDSLRGFCVDRSVYFWKIKTKLSA